MTGKKPSSGRGLAELSPLLARRVGVPEAETAVPAGPAGDRRRESPARSAAAGQVSAARRHAPRDACASSPIRSSRRAWCSPSWCARCRGRNPGESQRYEIIAGERRWRAAQMAGLGEIPAVIRDVPDEAAVAMALIENIQREDLNPLEEARALLAADRGVRA